MIFIYVACFKMLQISANLRRLLSRRQQWSTDEKPVGPAVPWTSLGPAIDMAKVDQVWQNLSRNTCNVDPGLINPPPIGQLGQQGPVRRSKNRTPQIM